MNSPERVGECTRVTIRLGVEIMMVFRAIVIHQRNWMSGIV